MATIKAVHLQKYISGIFGDENLTKRAFLNSISSILEYFAKMIVVFITQPMLVSGLGDYFFGTWQILLRFIGYIAPASGRPTQALRYALANDQHSTDYLKKKQYVGSALAVWGIFLPILTVLGAIITWFIPVWIKTPPEYVWTVRMAAAVLVANLIMTNLAAIPQSVLQGENLGYKRMGASTMLVFAGGGLIWAAMYLNSGIIGVAVASLLLTIITGLFFMRVARLYSPWFGIARSSLPEVWKFFGISTWFLLWTLIQNFMMASDVVILGMLNSVESVTSYSLTKYAPETLMSMMAIITFGISPGFGKIIGSGDKSRASIVRGELMALTWLITIALGATLVTWNQAFLALWVGSQYYSGQLANLIIVIVVMQFVFIRNDSNFIDLTLNLQRKVILGGISVALSMGIAAVFVGYFQWGAVGVSLGLLLGRTILSVGYPAIVGRHLDIPLMSQARNSVRSVLVSSGLLILAVVLSQKFAAAEWSGLEGWIVFLLASGVTFLVSMILAFYLGLSKIQRDRLFVRVKMVILRA